MGIYECFHSFQFPSPPIDIGAGNSYIFMGWKLRDGMLSKNKQTTGKFDISKWQRGKYKNFHSRIICNRIKLETIQMPVSNRMDKL